ncbi:PREDICTED: uncharacterized protein LOC109168890 [Ipomoea nil]|uniref:uncharacterized protein LOC109168890 n=1 Tax=Ipomoea nil TaxID=35883 RepID=UPI0009017FFF|nr:PREDICTED: uncharacterized protein LOC109168890 [Ipomoea nil]
MDVATSEPLPNASPVVEGEARRAPHAGKRIKILKRSFADTTTASSMSDDVNMSEENDADWLEEELTVQSDSESEDVREGIPVVKFSKAEKEDMARAWKRALIIKYLGKPPAFPILQQRLLRMWNIAGKIEMLDMGSSCYVVRFALAAEYKHVLLGGPWKLFNCYVIPQRWRPDFDPLMAKMEKMAVWVRFPGLPPEYFREKYIKKILKFIGNPIKLDKTTDGVERIKYARAAVEIDLLKPLVSNIWVGERIQRVEFEGLHAIFFYCGEVGHVSAKCPTRKAAEGDAQSTPESEVPMEVAEGREAPAEKVHEKYRSWMLVTKKNAKPPHITNHSDPKRKTKPPKSKERHSKKKGVANEGVRHAEIQSANLEDKVSDSPPTLPVSNGFSVLQNMEELHETPVFVEGESSRSALRTATKMPLQKGRKNKGNKQSAALGQKSRDKTATQGLTLMGTSGRQVSTAAANSSHDMHQPTSTTLGDLPLLVQEARTSAFVFGSVLGNLRNAQVVGGLSPVTNSGKTQKGGGGQTPLSRAPGQ